MCARLLACPLCSQPGFLTLDALRAGLISVATRPLMCPVCNEVLLGIDKLTIHLFSHSINLTGNTVESSKSINVTHSGNSMTAHNLQGTTFHEWNTSKTEIAEVFKLPEDNAVKIQAGADSHKNLRTIKNKVTIVNTGACMQNQNLSTKGTPEMTFLLNQASTSEEASRFHEPQEGRNITPELCKTPSDISTESMKLSYASQYYSNVDHKDLNLLQNDNQVDHENIETLKHWIQEQHYEQTSTRHIASRDIKKTNSLTIGTVESCSNEGNTTNSNMLITKNKDNRFPTYDSYVSLVSDCSNTPLERCPSKKNEKNDPPITDEKNQNENVRDEEILPHLKVFKALVVKEKTERCNICGFHFPDYNILLLHKQLVHMIDEKNLNVTPENPLKNYSCHLCSKIFKMRGSLMVHMRVAHMGYHLGSLPKDGQVELIFNENGYSCPTCSKRFKKEQHVIQHLKTHEAKQWECDVCSKMFTTKYFLKKHKRLHSGEMPYKCNICNKTFTFQQSYHKHRLYHKDDKPHTCTTCGRSFKELSTLHNHERIHTGEKPFACETCGKCFRQRVSYLVHRRIHTGVMPYKCIMCGKSFRYKVSQRTHKCPAQLSGNKHQASNLEQNLISLSDIQNINNKSCQGQQEPFEKNEPMLHVENNEENKYVLVINNQGQHLLTKEIDTVNAQGSKEQKVEEYGEINNELGGLKHLWDSNIPSNTVFKKSTETSRKAHSENEKSSPQDTNDFFSMVMSPLENTISSPTAEMEHLRVSSPIQKQNILESYGNFKSNDSVQMSIVNTNVEENFNIENNVTTTLQTINEESLKQLLYGIQEK